MSQTTYPTTTAVAFAGMLADLSLSKKISRINDDSVDIEFGVCVQNIPGEDDHAELVDAVGDKVLGVTIHEHNEAGKYEPGDAMSILREGVIWVSVDATVVEHGDVWIELATGAFKAADSGGARAKLANARWYNSRTGAGLVRVELGSNLSLMTET